MSAQRMNRQTVLTLILGVASLLIGGNGLAQESSAAAGKTVEINGSELYYETHGSGDPLLLLHGFSGSGRSWGPFVADLAKHYRIILPDLRGHGRSTNPSGEFTHRQAALDMYGLLDHLGIQRFRAMGTSTGGMTLIHMATQQPARPQALVLVAATIYFPEPAREIMRGSGPENLTPEQLERFRKIHIHGDDQIRALRAQFHAFKDSYDDMNFTAPFLATISAPTLIVHGDRDQFFPIEIPVQMYESIPTSYLWIVPNTGHGAIRNKREEFLETALAFLRGDWERSRQ